MSHLHSARTAALPFSPSFVSLLSYGGSAAIPRIPKHFTINQESMTIMLEGVQQVTFSPSSEFKRLFRNLVEDPTEAITLRYQNVTDSILAYQIIGEIGDLNPFTIGQIGLLPFLQQKCFRQDCLTRKGFNAFFCMDRYHELSLVRMKLGAISSNTFEWNIDATPFGEMRSIKLNEGDRVFSIVG